MNIQKTLHDRIDMVYRQLGINPNNTNQVNATLNLGSLNKTANLQPLSSFNLNSNNKVKKTTLIGISNNI